jgi:hypothetical protein
MESKKEEKVEVLEQTSESNPKDDFVTKQAYQDVSKDMHRYKQEAKEAKALLTQIEADKSAADSERLAEQGKWEELYEKNNAELTSLKRERQDEQGKFVDYHKKNSVLQKIGGFKRDEYNNFINVDSIQMNEDGSIDDASLTAEIDRVKQEYPELLKKASTTKLPNDAPNGNQLSDASGRDMDESEKNAYFKRMLKKQ